MKKYCVKIFGCQMNYADAERVVSVLKSMGWQHVENLDKADAVFLLTCSVRKKAEDKAFGLLHNLKKWKAKKSGRKVGLTGCMVRETSSQASVKKDALLRKSGVLDFVWRIEDSTELPKLLDFSIPTIFQTRDFFSIKPMRQNPTQVFVPIMTGCNNFCSYCIVPYTRGREISRSEKEILAECKEAVENGAIEITLLGQNVNSYQKTRGAFAKLLAKVTRIPNLKRLRFVSSHPKDFDESVIDMMAEHTNIERHLHLPAQHGDDEILQKMNRGYTTADYLKLLEKFRKKLPEASITTDLIVGFPGESEKNFKNLLNFYRTADFDFAFFSKYSSRPNTTAAKLPDDVDSKLKTKRWHRLNKLMLATAAKKNAKLKNKTLEVLVEKANCHSLEKRDLEKDKRCILEGRSSEFFLVKFEGNENLVGKIVNVKITQPREVELWGEIN
ncbi:tRNA (N6-isopentenyl adenosine(37)-C2)-methylthiotransferase MiaB [Candidatus Gracilibacteria bacterium]|nr:tRNA (N6-isopentenyl adenosine(37)-C2)-methylthiotransferase MiaB [Candidatus Gracilibacteria bacterium]